MHPEVKKFLRTAQSAVPFVKPFRDNAFYFGRRILGVPHDSDYEVIRLFRNEKDFFVDVGANQGQSIESILTFRKDARIASFEANPILGRKLKARYAGKRNITIHTVGLGEKVGRFTLYIPRYNGFVYDALASLHPEGAKDFLSRETVYGFDPSKLVLEEVECEVRTLDSFELAPSFIKIDVEGSEYQVLLGAQDTIRRHEPALLVECYSEKPEIEPLLAPYGYREYHLSDGRLVPGPGGRGPNSFLVPARRIKELTGR